MMDGGKWIKGAWYKPGELCLIIAEEGKGKSIYNHSENESILFYPDDGGLKEQKREPQVMDRISSLA